MNTSERIKFLEAQHATEERALRAAKDGKEEYVSKGYAAVRKDAAEMFDGQINDYSRAKWDTKLALDLARLKLVEEAGTGWLPVDTKVTRQHRTYGSGYWSGSTITQTGWVEVWSPDSVYPSTRSQERSYNRPNVGDIVVRLMKADGSRSKNYVTVPRDSERNTWKQIIEEVRA